MNKPETKPGKIPKSFYMAYHYVDKEPYWIEYTFAETLRKCKKRCQGFPQTVYIAELKPNTIEVLS